MTPEKRRKKLARSVRLAVQFGKAYPLPKQEQCQACAADLVDEALAANSPSELDIDPTTHPSYVRSSGAMMCHECGKPRQHADSADQRELCDGHSAAPAAAGRTAPAAAVASKPYLCKTLAAQRGKPVYEAEKAALADLPEETIAPAYVMSDAQLREAIRLAVEEDRRTRSATRCKARNNKWGDWHCECGVLSPDDCPNRADSVAPPAKKKQ